MTDEQKRVVILRRTKSLGVTEAVLADGDWTLTHPTEDIVVADSVFDFGVGAGLKAMADAVEDVHGGGSAGLKPPTPPDTGE